MAGTIFTVGHSTHALETFIDMLTAHGVTLIADVRIWPRSRRYPHFNGDVLAIALQSAGIDYVHLPGLGGRRKPQPISINLAWKNDGFRGYADYMQTPQFEENLARLIELSNGQQAAVMCAEAVPWRCHRALIADALIVRGITVMDILSNTKSQEHKLTPFARVAGTQVTYPAETLFDNC
jgi:uncharacterized protein (DUF488 family)